MDIRAGEDYLAYLGPFIHQISNVYASWEWTEGNTVGGERARPQMGCICTK